MVQHRLQGCLGEALSLQRSVDPISARGICAGTGSRIADARSCQEYLEVSHIHHSGSPKKMPC